MQVAPFWIHAGVADRERSAELVTALNERGWAAFDAANLPPGAVVDKAVTQGLAAAACAVLILSSATDSMERAAAVASVQKRAGVFRVVPVLVGDVPPDAMYAGALNTLQPVGWTSAAKVAAPLAELGDRLGWKAWGEQRLTVVVAGVLAEVGDVCRRLAEQIGRAVPTLVRGPPRVVDVGNLADGDGPIVLVIGARHGGHLARISGLVSREDCLVLTQDVNADTLDDAAYDEHRALRAVRRANPPVPDVGRAAVDAVSRWHTATFPPTPGGPRTLLPFERDWLEGQIEGWRRGNVGGFNRIGDQLIDRARVYVHLRGIPSWRSKAAEYLDTLLSTRGHPRVVVVGSAGCGKTALTQHLAYALACRHLRADAARPFADEPVDHLDADGLVGERLLSVPVLHLASTLAAALKGKGGAKRSIKPALLDLLRGLDTFATEDDLWPAVKGGRYLLIVDSLDEVADALDRQAVVDALSALATIAPKLRVILTTRPMAHADVDLPRAFQRVDLAPLDPERAERLVRARLAVLPDGDALAAEAIRAVEAVRADFPADDEGRSPAENPLLVAAMVTVWERDRQLPDDRGTLYDEMIDVLCSLRARAAAAGTSHDQQRDWRGQVEVVALATQERGGTELRVDAACEALCAAGLLREPKEGHAALELLVNRTGLIRFEARGAGADKHQVVRPWHRSFQEYLAARQLARKYANKEAELAAWLADGVGRERARLLDPAWLGCVRFLIAGLGQQGEANARLGVKAWLAAATGPLEGPFLARCAEAVAEYQRRWFAGSEEERETRRLLRERYAANGASWGWEERCDALDAWGRIEWRAPDAPPLADARLPDPRFVTEFRADTGWCRRGALWVRTWPVTVQEYAAFVDDGGQSPRDWFNQMRRPARPVVNVSLGEARAFCRWARERWRPPVDGGIVDLPSDMQWSRIAGNAPYPWGSGGPRAGVHAAFDWGNDPFGSRQGAPVGAFPRGVSPAVGEQQLWDLAGNVWEWTCTEHDTGHDTPLSTRDTPWSAAGEVSRSGDGRLGHVRGGSWGDNAMRLWFAFWDRHLAGGWGRYVGFRLVVRSPVP